MGIVLPNPKIKQTTAKLELGSEMPKYCTPDNSPENRCARFLDGKLACLLACFLQPLAYSSLGVASAWPPPSLVLQLSRDSSLPRPSSRRPLLLRRVLRQHREASLRVFGLEFLC